MTETTATPAATSAVRPGPGADDLPAGLALTFTSLHVTTPRLTHHVVTGGRGPALLLINGWPQTWYAWRLVMPALAEHFTVVAVEPRGVGDSDKPVSGYDTGSMAADLAAVMTALGHETFAVLGHDVGMWTGYALAADHPERVTRLAVTEAMIPGLSPEPPLFGRPHTVGRLFHFAFNRLDGLNEELVRGREHLYFNYQFETKTAPGTSLDADAVARYVEAIARDDDSLSASFGPYRALHETIDQNRARRTRPLSIPVLAIGGAEATGAIVGQTMEIVAPDLTVAILSGCGHFPAEEDPDALLATVLPFFRGRPE